MKVLKGFFLFAAACLMLAASWNLIGGDLPQVREARAQTSGVYQGPEIVHFAIDVGSGELGIVDVDGYFWWRSGARLSEGEYSGQWVRGQQVFAPGTPVPTASESIGSLKSRLRGD